jgi:hypothetical protein
MTPSAQKTITVTKDTKEAILQSLNDGEVSPLTMLIINEKKKRELERKILQSKKKKDIQEKVKEKRADFVRKKTGRASFFKSTRKV